MMWNVGWGTVSQCNMNCEFCYSKKRRMTMDDLGYKDWIKFIDENHEHINSINYGTGENTLSDKWFQLVAYIRENYPTIKQSLTTNGYLSVAVKKEQNFQTFIKAIDEVDVSLDFADRIRHNKFRGQPRAYEWAIDTLNLCNKQNKQTTLVFLGSDETTTYKNIDALFSIAQKYNSILRMNMYRPTNGIDSFAKKFIMSREHLIDVLKYINKNYHVLSIGDSYFSPILTGKEYSDPSGQVSIRILSDGSITPSTYLIKDDFVVANIKQKNVLEVLEAEESLKKIIDLAIPFECKDCVYIESCRGGVFDRRYLWYGTLEKKDPYCDGKYTDKILPIIEEDNITFSSVHDGYLPTMFFCP